MAKKTKKNKTHTMRDKKNSGDVVELMRLTADIIEYAKDEDDSSIKNALNYLRRTVMLKGDKNKNDIVNIIFMNVHKSMGVTRNEIETDKSFSDKNKYSKMFTYVLLKDIAMLTQSVISQYFEIDRATVKRYVDNFNSLNSCEKRNINQQEYMVLYEKIKKNVMRDVSLILSTSSTQSEEN
jgi:hypothetical protein